MSASNFITHRFLSLSRTKSHLIIPNPSNPLLLQWLLSHSLSSLSEAESSGPTQNPNPNPSIGNHRSSRSLTPLESQFQSWTSLLRPGFTPSDLEAALRSQSDPELALDLFRWSSLSPRFRHTPSTYLAILHILISSRRFSAAESLLHDVLSGACAPHLPLFNLLISFCSHRRHLFSTAFDIYKKMISSSSSSSSSSCRPDLHTYSMLLTMLLRRFGRPPVNYIHLHAVRSLVRHMKASGAIPDLFVLNLIIKAYSMCLEMDEAARVFREMVLYNCEPNEYSYGYIAKGMCEKGRVKEGMSFFKEMREKGLVPTSSVCMTVICSLVMERRFEEGMELLLEDMLGNGMKPDLLTYRTLLEGLCRDGRGEEAFELLEELRRRRGAMDGRMYSDLLDGLHWLNQPRPHD